MNQELKTYHIGRIWIKKLISWRILLVLDGGTHTAMSSTIVDLALTSLSTTLALN